MCTNKLVKPEQEPTTCAKCGKKLVDVKICIAALGYLYCSERCAVKHTGIEISDLELILDRVATKDIGITTRYTITGVDRAGKRFRINTNTPQHYNIWRGTVWANKIDGTRVMVNRIWNQ